MPSPERYRVLIPVLTTRRAADLLRVGAALLRGRPGQGSLLGVVEVPHGQPISRGVTVARRYRSLLNGISAAGQRNDAGFGVEVRVAHNLAQGIREAVYEVGANLLVLEWPGLSVRPGVSSVIANLVSDPPADLLLVRPDQGGIAPELTSILVPVRGGPSARVALGIANALAAGEGSPISVMHVYRPNLPAERRRREENHFHELAAGLGVPTDLIEIDSSQPGVAILAEAQRHPLTVIGAQAETAHSPLLVSSTFARTVRSLPGTVIVVKSASLVARSDGSSAEGYQPPLSEKQLSARVDRWFAENTFNSREFRDLDRLVESKRRQGLSISLGLPTLNESATIGQILKLCLSHLVERYRLLDEVVVIDSGSTDGTVEIARSYGVAVHQHPGILPEYGAFAGKGEALWKSLHLLRGDIVAWCDTD
ncbi:MAG: universal stress protein, partial [Candidatus Dormibacteraeota bacterium]|nr:universal stress protein [Candidatus Dormibacteraeota bacterium]